MKRDTPLTCFTNSLSLFDRQCIDCDNDEDCNFGLICLQRNLGTKDVAGCFGDPDVIGNGSLDFCIQPQDSSTLVIVGDEGIPASAFPLDQCQGDCDADNDWYVCLSTTVFFFDH